MNLHRNLLNLSFSHVALLVAAGLTCGCGQQASTTQTVSSRGLPEDWSTRLVKFSDPGSEADAIRNGTHDKWLRIVNDPRYQMQQLRRSPAWGQRQHIGLGPRRGKSVNNPLQRDWAYHTGGGIAPGTYPAKYGFDVNAAPTCTDFVVFPVDADGSPGQANIIAFNNLYDGSCPSSAPGGQAFAPTVKFAYEVGTGSVSSSPVLSEDGTKVAFIENSSTSAARIFHVLTLGTTGSNGSAYNAPVQPCTINAVQSCMTNNAIDQTVTMSGGSIANNSSPFVDYSDDIAYVMDFNGMLHKFTGVFRGSPAEVTTNGWPFNTGNNSTTSLVYDSVSEHIFLGQSSFLVCIDVTSGTPAFCATPSVSLGEFGSINDAPIVDSTAQTVFVAGSFYDQTSGEYEDNLVQTDTSLGNIVQANMGGSTVPYDGDFDNSYYSGSYSSGYMYFCGGDGSGNSMLYRIGFNSGGKMNSANDGNSYQLGAPGSGFCTPLTESYNASQEKDYLFLGTYYAGAPSGCDGQACVLSFELGSAFPSGPAAMYPLGCACSPAVGGIIVDNVSTEAGASQIYFFNNSSGNATQLSQNGLN